MKMMAIAAKMMPIESLELMSGTSFTKVSRKKTTYLPMGEKIQIGYHPSSNPGKYCNMLMITRIIILGVVIAQ